MELAVPGVKSLAPSATCSLCTEAYNYTSRIPKMICINGHTICMVCLDAILHRPELNGQCPTCQTKLPVNVDDARKYPSNYALLDVLEAFDKNEKRFNLGQATCSECCTSGGESIFYVCIPCSAKKGIFCDIEAPDFDWNQLDKITTCANCILKKHQGKDHKRIKLLALRVRRDRTDMDLLVTGAENKMKRIIGACNHANLMAEDAVIQLRAMVDLTNNVNSSIVLSEAKQFIQDANTKLVEKATRMERDCKRYEQEIMEQLILDKNKKNELAKYCMPQEEEEESEAEEQPPVVQEEEEVVEDTGSEEPVDTAVAEENTPQIVLSEAEQSMMNQDVALSQVGLAMAITTLAMVFLPIIQSPLVWNSLASLFSFLFRLFGSIFAYFFYKDQP